MWKKPSAQVVGQDACQARKVCAAEPIRLIPWTRARLTYLVEITCVLKYPESNGRTDGASPWSLRQTGLYQKFEPLTKRSLWVLLNPTRNSVAEQKVFDLLQRSSSLMTPGEEPQLLGLLLLSIYSRNWRTYMAYYEEKEIRIVRTETSGLGTHRTPTVVRLLIGVVSQTTSSPRSSMKS